MFRTPAHHQGLVVLLAILVATTGCGDDRGSDRPGDRPGDVVIVDMGPVDGGITICEGTAQPCAELPLASCGSTPGCYSGSCGGSPRSCLVIDFPSECEQVGCVWDYEFDWCDGSPWRCDHWSTDRSRCESAGCRWMVSDVCEGTPRSCASLGRSDCASTPGCNLIGEAPPDLGTDAGSPDLGPPDSGMVSGMCPAGECDYGENTGCPAGEGCYVGTDGAPLCLSAGSTALGAACTYQDDCAPGLICLGSGDAGVCRRICCGGDDAVCGSGSSCGTIDGIDGVGGCTLVCDPVGQTGCGTGDACYSLADGPRCASPGSGTQGATCTYQDDCAMGFGCVAETDTSYICAEYCDTASPSCSDPSLSCIPLMDSAAGACLE